MIHTHQQSTMLPHQRSSSTPKEVLVHNTAEQEQYRKRTVAIQRELRAMAVSLSVNRRRFLRRRADLLRRSTSLDGEPSAAVTEQRKADEVRGNAAVRALSAVLERPWDEGAEFDPGRQGQSGTNLDRHESCERQPPDTAGETVNQTGQSSGERSPKNSVLKYRQEVQEAVVESVTETASRKVSSEEKVRMKYTRESSVPGALHLDDTGKSVLNRRNMNRSPYARLRSESLSMTVVTPRQSDDETRNESSVISRRMRGMTVGATEQLNLSRLRQIRDVRVGSDSLDEEQKYIEKTHRRIRDFLDRTSSESVVSDASDLASESGSDVFARPPPDRRRTVSRVYALEHSPRLRKRSVPARFADAVVEEENDSKDKLRLPPLSLPPVHSNVPLKLRHRNYSKRGNHYKESTRIWTAEEWEDLKHCRYLRNKSIP